MIIAAACLLVFALAALLRLTAGERPLDPHEMHRLRRFSEKLHNEETLRFE